MANTDGQIVLGLDIPKTVSQINADIKKLEKQLKQIKASGALDTSSTVKKINAQITALQSQLKTIDIKANINTTDVQQTGQKVGQAVADATQKAIDNKNINIDKLNADVKTLVNNLNNFSIKNAGFDTFKTEINGVEVNLDSLISKLSTIDNVTDLGTIRLQATALKTAFTELSQINEIQLLSNGGVKNDYATQLAVLEGRFSRLGLKEDEIAAKTDNVYKAFDSLKTRLSQPFDESNFQEIITLNDKFQKELIESQNELTRLGASIKMATDSSRLNNVNQMQKWADSNGKAMKKWGEQINGLISQMGNLNNPLTKLDSDDILRKFKSIQAEAIRTGNVGMTTAEKFKNAWEKFGGWSLVTGAFTKIVHSARHMYQAVYEIDTAMTNLYKVTDETSSKYNQFLDSASDSAHELGRSISSLVEQTANWAKLGFSLDEAEQLAKISSIYANVGEVDNDTAVSDLVTAMKAFNIEASDSITIVDKLNKLGNEYATSAAALGDGLSRSASAMDTSGTDINKTLAMLTGGTEITQNASEFGNFLKVGSMRIRGKLLCLHTRKVCMRCYA